MRRFAVISDIHGNLPALEAVLSRLESSDIEGVICLGDTVGYGPWPAECLDLVSRCCMISVRGNHDEAIIDPRCAAFFNGAARTAVDWTRRQLGPLHLDAISRMRTMAHIGPHEQVMLVHDSPAPGPTDYIHDRQIAAIAFRGVDRHCCLVGHTHVPMIFEAAMPPSAQADEGEASDRPLNDEAQRWFITRAAVDIIAHIPGDGRTFNLRPDARYICNPGSIGQPRDGDPRASYAIMDLDAGTFTVHRESYDVNAAQEATRAAGLPPILADRLAIGA